MTYFLGDMPATTITWGTQSVTAELVTGYDSRRDSGNLLHTVIGRADPDVTLKAAGLRQGTLEVWCPSHSGALEVEALHAQVGVLHLTDYDQPGLDMFYVVAGPVETRPEIGTTRWLVRVAYAEVIV